jgi:hypothetical protein
MDDKSRGFDETAKEGAQYLLERFWILREKEPEIYQQIRRRENALKNFFRKTKTTYISVNGLY